MNLPKTQLIFILDRSGSMAGLEGDTIGGFNSMLIKQQGLSSDALVSTVLFDDKYELLHDRVNIKDISPITSDDYFVRGSTALLDAMGKTISTLRSKKGCEKVLFVIITDGMENSSREYTQKAVKELIDNVKEKMGWEFIFLGANIDAVTTARNYGISADRAVNYHPDSNGIKASYAAVCEAAVELRTKSRLSSSWKKQAEKNYISRKN